MPWWDYHEDGSGSESEDDWDDPVMAELAALENELWFREVWWEISEYLRYEKLGWEINCSFLAFSDLVPELTKLKNYPMEYNPEARTDSLDWHDWSSANCNHLENLFGLTRSLRLPLTFSQFSFGIFRVKTTV